jgi:predicted acyl esterase
MHLQNSAHAQPTEGAPAPFKICRIAGITIPNADDSTTGVPAAELTAALFLPHSKEDDMEISIVLSDVSPSVSSSAEGISALSMNGALIHLYGSSSPSLTFPCIIEAVPYRLCEGTLERDWHRLAQFTRYGYACLRIDLRGSGNSSGHLTDEYLESEMQDCEHVLAWVQQQRWSNQQCVMFGKSWSGFNALQLAARQNALHRSPKVAAVIAGYFTDDRYEDDIHFKGGELLVSEGLPWCAYMLLTLASAPMPRNVGGLKFTLNQQGEVDARPGERFHSEWMERLKKLQPWDIIWLRHMQRDEYWQHGSVCEPESRQGLAQVPLYLVGGSADGYTDPWWRLVAQAELRDIPELHVTPSVLAHQSVPLRRGVLGPWGHQWPDNAVPRPNFGWIQDAVKFLRDAGVSAQNGTAASRSAATSPSSFIVWQWTPCVSPMMEVSRDPSHRACRWLELTLLKDCTLRQIHAEWPSVHEQRAESKVGARTKLFAVPEVHSATPASNACPAPSIVQRHTWYIGSGGSLTPTPPVSSAVPPSECVVSLPPAGVSPSLLHGMDSAGGWLHWGYAGHEEGPADQSKDDAMHGVLTFESEALEADLQLMGIPQLNLNIVRSHSGAGTPWPPLYGFIVARLCAVGKPKVEIASSAAASSAQSAPSSEVSILLSRGLLNLSHAGSHSHPDEPFRQGTTGKDSTWLKLELSGVCCVIQAGWTLRLTLATNYWPWCFPHPNQSSLKLRLYGNSGSELGCQLDLPIFTASHPAVRILHQSEVPPPLSNSAHCTVTRDLTSPLLPAFYKRTVIHPNDDPQRWLLEVKWNMGKTGWILHPHSTIKDVEWSEEESETQTFTICEGDPYSAETCVLRSLTQRCEKPLFAARIETKSTLQQVRAVECPEEERPQLPPGVKLEETPLFKCTHTLRVTNLEGAVIWQPETPPWTIYALRDGLPAALDSRMKLAHSSQTLAASHADAAL